MRTFKIKFSDFDNFKKLTVNVMKKRDYKFVIVYEDDDDFDELIQKLRRNEKWCEDKNRERDELRVNYPLVAESIYIDPSVISLFRENRLVYDCVCDCELPSCNGMRFKFDESRLVKKN